MKTLSVSLSTIVGAAAGAPQNPLELLHAGPMCGETQGTLFSPAAPEPQIPPTLDAMLPTLCFRRYFRNSPDGKPLAASDAADLPYCQLTKGTIFRSNRSGRGQASVAVPLLFQTAYKGEEWGWHRVLAEGAPVGTQDLKKQDLVFLCERTELVPVLPCHLETWRKQFPACMVVLDNGGLQFVLFSTGWSVTL